MGISGGTLGGRSCGHSRGAIHGCTRGGQLLNLLASTTDGSIPASCAAAKDSVNMSSCVQARKAAELLRPWRSQRWCSRRTTWCNTIPEISLSPDGFAQWRAVKM